MCFYCLSPCDWCKPRRGWWCSCLKISELALGIFRRLHHQCLARDILHQAQGVFYVFFRLPQSFPGDPSILLYTIIIIALRVRVCTDIRYNIIRVHDAFHRRFPGPLPVITPFIRMENPRRRRFLSCSPLLFPSVRPSKKGQNSPFFHVLLSLHPKI